MLFRVILLPASLSLVPTTDEAAAFFYPAALSVLQDLAENCVVVCDSRRVGEKFSSIIALHNALQKWPEQFKIRAQRILTLLEKQNRFQTLDITYTPESKCSISDCQHLVGLATSLKDEKVAVIAGGNCFQCSSGILVQAETGDIRDYPVSEFGQKRRHKRSICLSDGQWTTAEFERFILSPILRSAEVLKLYDRLITRTLDLGGINSLGETADTLQANYRLTLEWIISVFARESSSAKKRVEIYSGVSTGADNKQLKLAEKVIQEFVETLAKKTGVRPSIFLKEETDRLRMPHGRYLITDKLGILIERGFDLLWDDKAMERAGLDVAKNNRKLRDVMVSICPDPGSVEAAASRLRNLRVLV
jgi:hypothetical protein